MGVEKARNLSHLSLESIPKSITNENGSVEYDPSIENHIQMNGNVGDIKEVSEKNCGECRALTFNIIHNSELINKFCFTKLVL